ncbi:hypothetical protein G9A89_001099 [Geosiphon pyriformis]|nr:hypothetical protein G9A89_001099 [Geosiphon pyriformis]
MNSMSGNSGDEDVFFGPGNNFLFGLAANTPKTKRVNTGIVYDSPLGLIDYGIDKDDGPLSSPLKISLDKNAVKGKSATAKTQFIKKNFSSVNGFGEVIIPSKFEKIIQSIFTSKKNIIKTVLLASKKEINVNSNLKKQEVYSDQAIVIKEFPMDMPKEMIIAAQKTVVEFTKLEQAKQLASRWSFLIGKDLVHVAMVMRDWDTWIFRDHFRVLLFTLLVETTAHNLSTLLKETGKKTCVINCFLETGNWVHYAIIGFESENELESAFCTKPIFGGVRLFWTRLDLVQCKKCGKFGHLALEYDASAALEFVSSRKTLAKLYVRKNVSIFHPATFGDKSWAQVSGFGSGFFSSGISDLSGSSSFVLANNLSLNAYLTSLKFSGIMHKLSGMELVPLALLSSSGSLITPVNINLDLTFDMVLDSSETVPAYFSVVSALEFSSLKILTTKMGCLESKLVALEASISSVLAKLDQLCAGSGS